MKMHGTRLDPPGIELAVEDFFPGVTYSARLLSFTAAAST
jgi:hypothetical protein